MDDETKGLLVFLAMLIIVMGFITYQIQTTNRAFIAQGFSYSPVTTTTYVTSWHK